MKWYFRNPEVQMDIFVFLLLSLGAFLTARRFDPALGVAALILCLLFGLWHFAATRARYRKIRALSEELNRALLGQEILNLSSYREGELSILQSELQKLTVRLRENADRLQKDKVFLRDSIADISHQLRTPLTSLNLVASMLAAPELPEQERRSLARQLQSLLNRIDWLIEALLKLSRFDAGDVHLRADPLKLEDVLQQAAAPLAIAMELREQTLQVRGGAEFTGDLGWTAEALGCILKNCMEHTPPGGVIDAEIVSTPLYAGVTIRDTGPGFLPEDIPHLFERFYKGKQASAESFGIGLSLAQKIVLHQNGTIRANNHPTGGAVFTVRFYHTVV